MTTAEKPMLCGYGGCDPGYGGVCKVCGGQVYTECDDNGNPLGEPENCTGDRDCLSDRHWPGCYALEHG